MVVFDDQADSGGPNGLLSDLPRGRYAEHIGEPSKAHFESPDNILATESLRFDAAHNAESKLFLGTVDGQVITGPRLPDGRVNRWVAGGTPIGVGDDRHHLLVAGSRAGKGRAALVPMLLTLPVETSILCVDPKGQLAQLTCAWRAALGQEVGVLDPFAVREREQRSIGVFSIPSTF